MIGLPLRFAAPPLDALSGRASARNASPCQYSAQQRPDVAGAASADTLTTAIFIQAARTSRLQVTEKPARRHYYEALF